MKTIALIDTRSEVTGKTLGILVSTHPDMVAAFDGNDAFQKIEAAQSARLFLFYKKHSPKSG